MLIGVAKEFKKSEFRVVLSPSGVKELIHSGSKVYVEKDAGIQIGFTNEMYESAGAKVVSREILFKECEMIVKVKELQEFEFDLMHKDQILFSYLHLAPDPLQTQALLEKKVFGVAFETVTDDFGLPLLAPMSEVAGKMSIQQGMYFLTKPQGGSGVLLGGVPGAKRGHVSIIGGGVVGINAAKVAIGTGARVTILDKSLQRLRYLSDIFGSSVEVLYSTMDTIEQIAIDSDIVVGGVLIPGAKAPKVINADIRSKMKKGSVLVDVAIDQGGCFEDSRATTHTDPVYQVDGINYYCVANIPGAVAKTSSMAIEAAVLPYAIKIAKNGKSIFKTDHHLKNGINVADGKVVYKAIADALNLPYTNVDDVL